MNILKNQPALITTTIAAVITLLVAFGVPVSDVQSKAILDAVTAVLAMAAAGLTTRALVTPTANPRNDAGTPLVPARGESADERIYRSGQ